MKSNTITFRDINGNWAMLPKTTPFVLYETTNFDGKKSLVVQTSCECSFYVPDDEWDRIITQVEEG